VDLEELLGRLEAAIADGEVDLDLPVFAVLPDPGADEGSSEWYEVPVIGVELDDDGDDEVDIIVDSGLDVVGLDIAGFRAALIALDDSAIPFDVYLRGEWEDLGDDEFARIDRPVERLVVNSERTAAGVVPFVDRES